MTTRQDLIDGFQMIARQGTRVAEGFGPQDWSYQVHDEEAGWTVKHTYCHLTASAEVLPGLLGALSQAKEGDNAAAGIDINAFNAQSVAAREGMSEPELIQAFQTAHEKAIEVVQNLSDEQLQQRRRFGAIEAPVAELLDTFFILHGISHIYHTTSRPLN
ncbi:MAG: maleylpyruvate isomerase N-terminal domain-containing protein [Dehalococcoidia bacterium]|nr:maleylpyruvate isomerase N-terminal domain-containing protein [Dehalococcoidia bacterium]